MYKDTQRLHVSSSQSHVTITVMCYSTQDYHNSLSLVDGEVWKHLDLVAILNLVFDPGLG